MAHPRETRYFVATLAPPELAETIMGFRAYMGERYGCRSGFRTPPHVTLVPPFAVTAAVDPYEWAQSLEAALEQAASRAQPFIGEISGFGAFADRTLYAHVVPDSRWDELRHLVYASLSTLEPVPTRENRMRFVPHLTIANRDIPAGALPAALSHFAEIGLEESLGVDHLSLLKMEAGPWEVVAVWPLGGS